MSTAQDKLAPLPFDGDDPPFDRASGIGGTDASAVIGVSRWKSPLRLYAEKVGAVEPDDLSQNRFAVWGKRLENIVAECYAAETRRLVRRTPKEITFDPEKPFLFGSLDRIATDPKIKGDAVLEIKTGAGWKRTEWDDEPPLEYQVQVQHYLMVTGLTWASFGVLLGGSDFRAVDVPRNDRFIARLREAELIFWDRVQRRDPPDPDHRDASTLSALWHAEEGREIALPGSLLDVDAELRQLKAEEKKQSERIALLENQIKAQLAEATVGVLPDGTIYTYKPQRRGSYTVAETEYRVLRRKGIKG